MLQNFNKRSTNVQHCIWLGEKGRFGYGTTTIFAKNS